MYYYYYYIFINKKNGADIFSSNVEYIDILVSDSISNFLDGLDNKTQKGFQGIRITHKYKAQLEWELDRTGNAYPNTQVSSHVSQG